MEFRIPLLGLFNGKVFYCTIAVSIAVLLASTSHGATLVQVDFNEPATDPTVGGTWNVIADDVGAPYALLDNTGAASGISLGSFAGAWGFSSTSTANEGAYDGGIFDNAASDLFTSDGIATFDLFGFSSSDLVNVKVAASSNTGDRLGDYLFDGLFANALGTAISDDFDADSDGFDNGSIMEWNLTGSTSYTFEFIDENTPSGNVAILSGLIVEVTSVPEPASIAIWSILGLGLAGFGYYRIRQKN